MLEFSGDSENGSLGAVTRLAEDWYQIGLRPDTAYWTHFRVRGCRGREITFNLTFTSRDRANRWAVRDTGNPEDPDYGCRNPYYSYDGRSWHHFSHARAYITVPNTVSFRQRFEEDEAYVCYTIPYTYSDLQAYLGRIQDRPRTSVGTLGQTQGGRDVPVVTLAGEPPAEDVVFLICREDGDEPTSNCALEGLIDHVSASDDPRITELLARCTLQIVPMVAIDAVVAGSPYGGPHDVMARRWMDDELLPEIARIRNALDELLRAGRVRLVGKLHGGQTYDNAPVWDFRIFDRRLRRLLPTRVSEPLDPEWNPFVRDAVPWVRQLTIVESWLQQAHDFWNFFSVHTNGRDPDQLRRQGARFAGLLASYVLDAADEGSNVP